MADAAPAIKLVLIHEGGYSNDPSDPGGETKFGIAKRWYPDLDIKNLTVADATEIYLRDYWEFAAVPDQRIANCLMDSSVHQGRATAIRMFQVTAGVSPDGLWGPATALAAPKSRLLEFQLARLLRYVNTVAQNPAELKDLGGWFRRTLDC